MHSLRQFLSFIAKAITIVFTLLTLVLIIITFARPEWIEWAIEWVGALIISLGNWNYLIAFAAACIESLPFIGTAVPGMNVMILVGGFWGKDHFVLTVLLASLGAMLGNYLGYWLGKSAGKELIEKYGEWFGIGRTEEKILASQLQKNGFWYITLGKFHNFTRAFIPFIAGTSGMLERKFWIYNMIGSVIWAVSINLIGIFFIDNYETILDHIGKVTLGIIVAIFAYFWFFKKASLVNYWNDKNREIEEKIAKKTNAKNN